MWNYSEKVMDHFLNPRNAGEIQDADGVGEVGNILCGDAIKLYIKLAPDQKTIEEARFQTFGCASAIASASALTEMLKGKTVEEAASLTNQDIADFLGELPEEKMHCSVMGMEAFQSALENLREKHPEFVLPGGMSPAEGEDRIVCQCFNVTERKIREVILANKLSTVEQVTHYCKAGGGCGGCIPDIEEILVDTLGKKKEIAIKESPPLPGNLTNLQKMRLIEKVFDEVIRPGLQADGGDAELVDIDGNKIQVRLKGRCAACHAAEQTLKLWVEAKLHEKVSPALMIEEIK
jgi:NifU-like protein